MGAGENARQDEKKKKGKIAVKYMDGSSLLLICVYFKVGDTMG